jgi:branched-chain amino acid aminotransferase
MKRTATTQPAERLVNMNGSLVPRSQATISVFDHGLLYGDGVFEGIRAYHGKAFRLHEHIDRLYDSAKSILLKIPITREELTGEVLRTLAANAIRDGYVRLVITRGVGDLGLGPDKCPKAYWFCIADTIKLYPEEFYQNGLALLTVPTRRNVPEALNPKIKSLNYLNNILAKIEANQRGVHEAIMLNSEGYVAECTGDNIFILQKGRLLTPPSWVGALEGITRQVAMELAAKMKVKVAEEPFTRYDIYTADEAFLTGTAAEIVPVIDVDGRPVGDGKPGKVTRRLIAAFRELTRKEGVKIPYGRA